MYHVVYGIEELNENEFKDVTKEFEDVIPKFEEEFDDLRSAYSSLLFIAGLTLNDYRLSKILDISLRMGQIWITFEKDGKKFTLTFTVVEGE